MVRNEGKIIRRMLNSALPIIDAVFILDTGSTDNTKEEVTKFLEENNYLRLSAFTLLDRRLVPH